MSRSYAFRILNVFAMSAPFTGNPLCVFEDASGLDDREMQALAKQFNLSETTFMTPSARATSHVRIFTPGYEMPFAGHPTLGTAAVAGERHGLTNVTLEMKAGVIPVEFEGGRWSLQPNPPRYREARTLGAAAARLCTLEPGDVVDALFVDTGREQAIVQIRSAECVREARPNIAELNDKVLADDGHVHLLLWAFRTPETIEARFFFDQDVALLEDPATGSACANLGGRLLRDGIPHARTFAIAQGAQTGRPSELVLTLSERGTIHVAGRVDEIGRGTIDVP